MKTTFRHFWSIGFVLAALALAMPPAHAQQCAAGDFNRDGKSDVFWLHNTLTQSYEWQMNGKLISASGSPASTGDTGWQVKGIADFDGDGKADVLFRHSGTGAMTIWLMNGTAIASSGSPGTVDLSWQIQATGDFNGDGKADILWMNTDGTVLIWFMNGTVNSGSSAPAALGAASGWMVQGAGDFNGDGKADILWKHTDGTVVLWMMNGGSIASSSTVTNVGPHTATGWLVQGVGDFNGDGKADVLWRNDDIGGVIYVWIMNGAVISSATNVTGVGTEVATGWIVRSIGDYNGDGRADIFWKNDILPGNQGITYVWLMAAGGTTIQLADSVTGVPDTGWKNPVANYIAPCPALTPSIAASRVSGVAPLVVFFDASGTVAVNPASSRTFHDLEYRWNFGDPAGSPVSGTTWSNGARPGTSSRNAATGPIAAHVFENPGTFTVTLTVVDGSATATKTVQIVVDDPETTFNTTTVCINVNGDADFAGCPGSATHTSSATNDFDALMSAQIAAGKRRILFKRGGTWFASTTAVIKVQGPGIVGSYGVGNRPIVQLPANIGADTGIFTLSSSTTTTMKDWRIMDLELDGNNKTGIGIIEDGSIDQVTLLRLNTHNLSWAYGFNDSILDFYVGTGKPQHIFDQIAVVDSMTSSIRSVYSYYGAANRLALMGNNFDNGATTGGSHVIRVTCGDKIAINNNTVTGAKAGDHNLKMHSMIWNQDSVCNPGAVGTFTQNVHIADNKFIGGVEDWSQAIGPEDDTVDERVRQVIVERNWFTGAAANQSLLKIWAKEATVRNNLFDATGMTTAHEAMHVERRGGAGQMTPTLVNVYNNTFFSSATDNDFAAINVDNVATFVVVRNNLGYAPSDSNHKMVTGAGGGGGPVVQSNNSTNTQVGNPGTNPNFTSATPSLPADFVIKTTSYAKNAGFSVPVFSDFFGNARPQGTIDMGFSEIP